MPAAIFQMQSILRFKLEKVQKLSVIFSPCRNKVFVVTVYHRLQVIEANCAALGLQREKNTRSL